MTQQQTKYKQTEIGMIPEDWEVVGLGELINEIIDNRGKNPEYYVEKGIPVIDNFMITGSKNIDLTLAKRYLDDKVYNEFIRKYNEKGDILMTLVGNGYGNIGLSPNEKSIIIQNTIGIRVNSETSNIFLLYYLIQNRKNITDMNRGAAQPSVKVGDVKKLKISLPPLPEQVAIAEILSSLDDKIELLEKQNKTLENIGQSLFQSWFVDFEPFSDDLIESDMGMIPRGWKVGKVGDFASIKSGFSFKSEDFSDEGVNIIKIKNINDGYVELKDVDKVDDSKLPKRAFDFELIEGDILVAMSGNTTGKIAMMPKFDGQFLLNQRAGKFFMKEEKNTGFMYFFLKTNNIGALILQTAYGSAQPNISGKDIENFDIIIPNSEILEEYAVTGNNLIKKINTNIYQIQTLSHIRDSLLPRLMSGKIRTNI